VHFAALGALSTLARIPAEVVDADPDVRAIHKISASGGDLEVLAAYCATGSLQQAAELLYLHHSSVARRLQTVSRRLGLDLGQPHNRLRAEVALILSALNAGTR
jgi:DNA-binding PucR family transcriptional regulator